MQTKITLSDTKSYQLSIVGLGVDGDLTEFAWLHILGNFGSAKVHVADRRKPGGHSDDSEFVVKSPGALALPIRKSIYPLPSLVLITAETDGFKGEIQLIMQQASS